MLMEMIPAPCRGPMLENAGPHCHSPIAPGSCDASRIGAGPRWRRLEDHRALSFFLRAMRAGGGDRHYHHAGTRRGRRRNFHIEERERHAVRHRSAIGFPPAGVQLYSPRTAAHLSAISRYLRFEAGIPPRLREIAILVTAREMDSQFEWVAHETEALKEGVEPAVIDVIKHRRSIAGLDATDATVIQLGRQLWRDHNVASELFGRAKSLFGPHKLVDLVLLMGNYAGTAALLTAVDMQLHKGKQPLLPIP